jgi:hypothetical protein
MPLLVTAYDIQQSLTKSDATALGIDRVMASHAQNFDAATIEQWTAYYAGYAAFSAANRNLGFWTLGLPAIADQAIAYEHELAAWQGIVNSRLGGVIAPGTVAHDQVDEMGKPPSLGLDTGTKWLIGGGLVLAGIFLLKR